jgi:hypothetical protein
MLLIYSLACDLLRDSDGALDRIRGATMRIGVARRQTPRTARPYQKDVVDLVRRVANEVSEVDWRLHDITVTPVRAFRRW